MKMKIIIGLLFSSIFASITYKQYDNLLKPEEQRERTIPVEFISEGVLLKGKLWIPAGKGPFPAVVTNHGSGKTTKENSAGIAQVYNQNGIAVLSHDKRGVGESGGEYENVSICNARRVFPLLAADASSAINKLKEFDFIDKNKLGLWGGSQAGWVFPITASINKDVSFLVLRSGPLVSIGEEAIYSSITHNTGEVFNLFTNAELEKIMNRARPDGFDPAPFVKKVSIPSLWLFGSQDEMQPTAKSINILKEIIDSEHKPFTYKLYEGANHNLLIDGKFNPQVMKDDLAFLRKKWNYKIMIYSFIACPP